MFETINPDMIRCVGIVDDDELGREELMDDLRDRNFEPVAVTGSYGQNIERLVSDLVSHSPHFIICDHRLQQMGLASFFGLDVVQKLLELRLPAMLLTMYQSTDSTRMQLRSARPWAPLIMGRDSFQPDDIRKYADLVQREINGNPVDHRRPHRVLLRVVSVVGAGDIEALVPSWNPEQVVTVPAACIDKGIKELIKVGDHILGDVNIGACSEDDIYFKNLTEIVCPKNIVGIP